FAAVRFAVAAQEMGGAVDEAPHALRPGNAAQTLAVAHEKVEQGHRIGARPFAPRPGFVPAHRAGCREPYEGAPAMEPDDRHRPGRAAAEDAARSVWQGGIDTAGEEPCIDAIENGMKAAAEQAREHAPTCRESAVGGNEMTASGLLIHRCDMAT